MVFGIKQMGLYIDSGSIVFFIKKIVFPIFAANLFLWNDRVYTKKI
jgi:hypothetical protein